MRAALPLALAALALAGCANLAPQRAQPEITAQLPGDFPNSENSGPYRPDAWWTDYDDPVLDALVRDALADNLDIAEASARVAQAAAQARIARSALFPRVNASVDANYSNQPLSGNAFGALAGAQGGGQDGGQGGQEPPTRIENDSYSLGLGASYELDLFGRVRNDFAAARADAIAAEYDFRSVQLAAAAETIATYFEVVDARRQIELTLETIDLLSERVAQTEERFRRGLTQSFELYQVQQDQRNTQASLPQAEAALDDAQGRLALLVRQYPDAMEARLARPLTPRLVFDEVPAGLPAELLGQRPDVAAAWARLEAARARVGARKAERFPSINLTAGPGTQGGDIAGAFDVANNWAVNLAAGLTAPIFQGGRISANIEAARANYDVQATIYARTVLTAFREANSAIEDYEENRQRYELILAQLEEAQFSAELQARRFEAGVGDYVSYLDALRAVYQVEAALSSAGRGVALSRLGVHRTLGGDWAAGIEPNVVELVPALPEATPSEEGPEE
ncbi:efflux transporter outer membrane subunit [Alteriqipengyuania lutimaris]|uniref:TolC family protein n=1 Tax=Alteriqipengyuania lutimaris TaxID=1538146 RepID=A0A395LLL8_9SPHN|nr:TolC family protein [Alteriqipengyuania lutimaris]MBB3033740.1 NodT family efflux transporter outer membrane factor (OMF) lipoprotein [Alteriqipengyuania lutimaris]RDS77277.1 TolC family protein [Alteriqipengyuania lutimaris]